jgi:hypothetical protein
VKEERVKGEVGREKIEEGRVKTEDRKSDYA